MTGCAPQLNVQLACSWQLQVPLAQVAAQLESSSQVTLHGGAWQESSQSAPAGQVHSSFEQSR
jgi:hypothetical protein